MSCIFSFSLTGLYFSSLLPASCSIADVSGLVLHNHFRDNSEKSKSVISRDCTTGRKCKQARVGALTQRGWGAAGRREGKGKGARRTGGRLGGGCAWGEGGKRLGEPSKGRDGTAVHPWSIICAEPLLLILSPEKIQPVGVLATTSSLNQSSAEQ